MTKKEALLFFPLPQDEDIEDFYEELLFEYKQFFISKFPINKVFIAKEKKMLQMHEAYLLLGGEKKYRDFLNFEIPITLPPTIKECFEIYQQNRNLLKSKILKASTFYEITSFINCLLELQHIYNSKWINVSHLPDTEIQISNEPDPMTLILAIKDFNSKGGITFDDLNALRNISPNLLLNEAKRLSLSTKIQ